ncbi:hypothetical protein Cpir12675_003737 [Ceratocystis pirilliformis]|uniref:Uncharacterized protein n=1 Tax=Ceratocystis pirilliformis TaxID=259994 RepID=A0ABR3Z107_9PEZI
MSMTRIIADSDDEEDQLTSEALSTRSGPPPAKPAAHMFTHVASQGPTPGLNTHGIQDTPVVVSGVSTLNHDATRLASARSNSTDPAFFAALYSREHRAALGQGSSLPSVLGPPTTATVAVNSGSQQPHIHCISDLTVLPQGLNSLVKRAATLNNLSSSLQSCFVPKQQRLNSTADGPDAQKSQNLSTSTSSKPTILSKIEKPRSVSELEASKPLTKKRKLDRWRDSSPDIILVTEAQALTSGYSTSACTTKSPAKHGDIDLHAFDSSPTPPVSAKKQRRIAPRTEEVDELAQPYVGPPQNLTPLGPSIQRPPLEQNNDASKWQPAPAPMAVMEVSRSTQAALTLNAKIEPDGVRVEPSIIAEQLEGMKQQLEEPPRSGRSVHDQIADSEDEYESDPPLVRLAPETGKGKVLKEKEAEIPDTQSFSQHTSPSLVLGEGMVYKVAEKIQAEQSVSEKKEKSTKKKALSRKQKATSKRLLGKKHGVATAVATEEPQRQMRKLTDVIAISDDESNDDDHSSTPTSASVSARKPELEPEVKPEPKLQLNSEPPPESPAKTAKGKTKKSITKKPLVKKTNLKKGTAKSKKPATPDPLPVVEIPSPKPETSGPVAPRGNIEISPPNPAPQESAESAPVRGRSESTISTPTTKSTDSAPKPNDRQSTPMGGKSNTEASQAKPVISLSVSKPVYRVGLSRRSRIAPLLKIVRKT